MLLFIKLYSREFYEIFFLLSSISLLVFVTLNIVTNLKHIDNLLAKLSMWILKVTGFLYLHKIIKSIITLFFVFFSFIHYLLILNLEKRSNFNKKSKNGFIGFNEHDMYNSTELIHNKLRYRISYFIFYSYRFNSLNDLFVDWARWLNNKVTDRNTPSYIAYYLFLWGYIFRYFYILIIYLLLVCKLFITNIINSLMASEGVYALNVYILTLKNVFFKVFLDKHGAILWSIYLEYRLQFYYLMPNFVFYHLWTYITKGKYWAKWYLIDNIDEYCTPRWIYMPDIKEHIIRSFIDKFGWVRPFYINYNKTGLNCNIILNSLIYIILILLLLLTILGNVLSFVIIKFERFWLLIQYSLLKMFNLTLFSIKPLTILYNFINKITAIFTSMTENIYLSSIPYALFLSILFVYKYIVIYMPMILTKLVKILNLILFSLRWIIALLLIFSAFSLDLLEFFSIYTLEWVLRDFTDILTSTYTACDHNNNSIILHNPYWGARRYSTLWWARMNMRAMRRRAYLPVLYTLDNKLYDFIIGLQKTETVYRQMLYENTQKIYIIDIAKKANIWIVINEIKTKRLQFLHIYWDKWIAFCIVNYIVRTCHFFWLSYLRNNATYAICLLLSFVKMAFILLPFRFITFILQQQHIWLIWIIYKILIGIGVAISFCINILSNIKLPINQKNISLSNLLNLLATCIHKFYITSCYNIIFPKSKYELDSHKWMFSLIFGDAKLFVNIFNYYDINIIIKLTNLLLYNVSHMNELVLYISENSKNANLQIIIILLSWLLKVQLWMDNLLLYLQIPQTIRKHGVDYINRMIGVYPVTQFFSKPRRTAIYTHSNWLLWPNHYWYCLKRMNMINIKLDFVSDFSRLIRVKSSWFSSNTAVVTRFRDDKVNKGNASMYFQTIINNYSGKSLTKIFPSAYQGIILDSLFIYYFTLLTMMFISKGFYNAILSEDEITKLEMNRQYAWTEFRSESIDKKSWFFYDRETAYKHRDFFKFSNNWSLKNSYYPLYLSKISDISNYNDAMWPKLKELSLLQKSNRIDALVWVCPLFLNYYTLPQNSDMRKNEIQDGKNFQLLIAFGYSKDKLIELSWNHQTTESYEDILQEATIDDKILCTNLEKEQNFWYLQYSAEKFLSNELGKDCKFAFCRDNDNLFQIQSDNINNFETKYTEDESQDSYTPWGIIFWFIICPMALFYKAFNFISGYNHHHQVNTTVLALQEYIYLDAIFTSHFLILRSLRDFTTDWLHIYKNRANIDTPRPSAFRRDYFYRLGDDISFFQYFMGGTTQEGYDTFVGRVYWTPQWDYSLSDIDLTLKLTKVALTTLLIIYSIIKARILLKFRANQNYKKYLNYKKIKIVIKKIKIWYWQ